MADIDWVYVFKPFLDEAKAHQAELREIGPPIVITRRERARRKLCVFLNYAASILLLAFMALCAWISTG